MILSSFNSTPDVSHPVKSNQLKPVNTTPVHVCLIPFLSPLIKALALDAVSRVACLASSRATELIPLYFLRSFVTFLHGGIGRLVTPRYIILHFKLKPCVTERPCLQY